MNRDDGDGPDQDDTECADKTLPKMKSAICRRWTHNEQVIYRCGVIVSRATFFDAESISNCLVSVFGLVILTEPGG